MPNIPFPSVPAYPGVPQLMRPIQAAVAENPLVAIGLGTVENVLGAAFQQAPQWGIFDSSGEQIGVSGNKLTALRAVATTLKDQITGNSVPVLSTLGVDYLKEMRISDFPLEGGSFANYNKVEMPANPTVTLAFAGSESDRSTFLNAIDAACKSTEWYSIVTPEVSYIDYTMERYTYSRRAYKGATLLIVAISLKEIREVAASYTTASPIVNPQNAGAAPQVNSGMTQPAAPDQSTLLSIVNKITALSGAK